MHRLTVVASVAIALAAGLSVGGQESTASRGALHVAVANLRVSANTTSGSRNECWLTASATNRNFLVAVSQSSPDNAGDPGGPRRCMTAISRNGGETWRGGLPKQDDGAFDPMTVAAPDGRVSYMQGVLGLNAGVGGGTRREGTIRRVVHDR